MSESGVAVVLTCYELGRTLPAAVHSVLAQTAAAQEVVVVDDGSRSPFTRQVLDWLEEFEQRVRVVRLEHGGVARARNLGVQATSAPLVVLLDGDDELAPTYLERAASILANREDLSFVCCAMEAFGGASYRWKPPPYTIAEAVGRGACGHISTMFRRDPVWERLGGFDETLPAYEDLDFWLRALEERFNGLIFDEPLLRYRVRPGSRYHGAVVRGDYGEAKELLLRKHANTVLRHGEDIFVTTLDFHRELDGHQRTLADEEIALRRQRESVEEEISAVREELDHRGLEAVAWGSLADEGTAVGIEPSLERRLRRRALFELVGDKAPRKRLTISPDDPWPDGSRRFERVVVDGALETTENPAAALAACRNALAPGGELVVIAATSALGGTRLRGVMEGSLRGLLCEFFPSPSVRLQTFGNLLTTLAVAANRAATCLEEAELQFDDPDHPTLVGAVARAHRRTLRRSRPTDGFVPFAPPRTAVTRSGVVLLYHRISDADDDPFAMSTTPENFARHMELVAERCTPLPLTRLVELARTRDLPPSAVAITFDDGYYDNLAIASPLLLRLGIPATFFVNGPQGGPPREAWWDEVRHALTTTDPRPRFLQLPSLGLVLSADGPAQRRGVADAVQGHLLNAGPTEQEAILADVRAWAQTDGPRETHRLMTDDELVKLDQRPGHEVGAHGARHLLLTHQPDHARREELARCKEGLERLLGRTVTTLAYPYGECDLSATCLAEELGFTVACGVAPDPVTAESDPLRLPRFELKNEEPSRLSFMLDSAARTPA